MTTATPPPDGGGGGSATTTTTTTTSRTSGATILSDKVGRALEVRTDTVAMKAALEALAQLPDSSVTAPGSNATTTTTTTTTGSSTTTTTTTGGIVDSRSVRVAIEQDALRQALLMQEELQALVNTVGRLRQCVSDTAAIANRVSQAIDADVVASSSSSSSTIMGRNMTSSETKDDDHDDDDDNDDDPMMVVVPEGGDAMEHERQLAARLYDAFREREDAAQRTETVNAFLEKFDLSEHDSQLLNSYGFEDMAEDGGSGGTAAVSTTNAMAFLDALERVRRIRSDIGSTFGSSSSSTAAAAVSPAAMLLNTTTTTKESSSYTEAQKLGATSAIRMMESLATKQENAYERLYHWLQKYLNLNSVAHVPTSGGGPLASHHVPPSHPHHHNAMRMMDEDTMDEALSHPFVRRSLHVLQHVPAFYSHTLELIASSRRSEETRRFLLALTSGYNGMQPIEVKAHDPVNYVGDMLAFTFRSFNMEADIARGLVEYKAEEDDDDDDDEDHTEEEDHTDNAGAEEGKKEEEHTSIMDGENEEGGMNLDKPMGAAEILDHAMSGVSRPLKSRILQVVSLLARRPDEDGDDIDEDDHHGGNGSGGTSQLDGMDEEGAVARDRICSLYSLCGLLLFYHVAITKAVRKLPSSSSSDQEVTDGERTTAAVVPNSVGTAIMECLEEAAQSYAASMRVYSAMIESLAMASGESEASLAHSMMTTIAEARLESPGYSVDVACPRPQVETSLSLDFACETLVENSLSFCRTLDDAVTLKVAITTAKKAGLAVSRAAYFSNLISEKEQTMIHELVETETKDVLEQCGLGSLVVAWKRMQQVYVDGMVMATHPGLSPEEVETSMKEFYSSLYSPPLPRLENVKDPVLRKSARSQIAASVAKAYAELYEALTSDMGGYVDLGFMGHTPSQVRTLFSA